MPTLKLDIQVVPTYDKDLLSIQDISTYATTPTSPTIEIKVPGWDTEVLVFVPNTINNFDSTELGITTTGNETAIPDGIYYLKYLNQTLFRLQNF